MAGLIQASVVVYAIGARYLQLSRDGISVSSEAHYAAASQDVDMVFEVRGLENLQCMLLLTIYQLRSPRYVRISFT